VWVLVSVSQVETGLGQRYTLWRHSDVTADRERQEAAFAKLQFIISYLDRAPAGFFSTTAEGEIAYVNATLADWLGLDLARTTDGSLKLTDILSPADAQLVMSIAARPGSVRTESFDLDLKPPMPGPFRSASSTAPTAGRTARPSPRARWSSTGVWTAPARPMRSPRPVPAPHQPCAGGHGAARRPERVVNANGAFVALSEGKVRGAAIAELVSEADRPA
jgi:two-component system, cell cycle sensor histidine kinase and response regulator CckA